MSRDITKRQYLDALERNGLKSEGFMGYVMFPDGVAISARNADDNRRARLAYLLSHKDAHQAPAEQAAPRQPSQGESSALAAAGRAAATAHLPEPTRGRAIERMKESL